MKSRIQFSPALTLAFLCSLAWFALWLSAFQPALEPPFQPVHLPPVALHPRPEGVLRTLQSPTLFARPSAEGFSGTFPENRVDLSLSLERPHQPETYLDRRPAAAPAPDRTQLMIETIPLPQSDLPAPGAPRTAVERRPERIELFFSAELQTRASETGPLKEIEDLSTASLRIHLTVRPDGTVAHAFFDTPAEQPALLSAIRRIRFTPEAEETSGWLDIRFTPQSGETN